MFRKVRSYLLIIICSAALSLQAQTYSCVDSTKIQYGYICNPNDFIPVCACNNKTYRNDCDAVANGVQQYNYGICEAIAIDENPNPVLDLMIANVILKQQGDMIFFIFDYQGNLFYYKTFSQITSTNIQLDISGYKPGIYILLALSDYGKAAKKIMKRDIY